MGIVVSLNVPDYLYQFYRKSAEVLGRKPEERMEQTLFMYAGTIAKDMIKSKENTEK